MALNDLRPALRTFLLGDSGISAAVGGTRVYPLRMPQGVTATSIVVNDRISETTDYKLNGASGLVTVRTQVDSWAATADAARSLDNKVKERLSGHSGTMGTVKVQSAFADNAHDDYDDSAKLYRSGRDYTVVFEET